MKPVRIQRKRSKGWEMPPNTVVVSRWTKWGNPFVVNPKYRPGSGGRHLINVPTAEDAVECYREMVNQTPDLKSDIVKELRGKNLACWCKLDQPCHADVLLEIANG